MTGGSARSAGPPACFMEPPEGGKAAGCAFRRGMRGCVGKDAGNAVVWGMAAAECVPARGMAAAEARLCGEWQGAGALGRGMRGCLNAKGRQFIAPGIVGARRRRLFCAVILGKRGRLGRWLGALFDWFDGTGFDGHIFKGMARRLMGDARRRAADLASVL